MPKVNKWRVYINTFDENGAYVGYREVTTDVDISAISTIEQNLDNTDYDIGVYRNSNITLTLNNKDGLYSDIAAPKSIFRFKRTDSLVKITWEIQEEGPYCGNALSGDSWLSTETTMFIGLLNDDSATMDLDQQEISFSVLGRESIFDRVTVPALVAISDTLSSAIYNCLNQSRITAILNVTVPNIAVGIDSTLDSVTDLQNKTVKDALNDLLLLTNSVLYISGDSVIVAPRTATVSVQQTFYGQASTLGPENIANIVGIRSGLNRTYNYFYWKGNSTPTQYAASVLIYGIHSKKFDFTYITDATKQATLMAGTLSEFQMPKQELSILTPMNVTSVQRQLLDRVAVDYPTIYTPADTPVPICGVAVLGVNELPNALWAFQIGTTTNFKIIGKSLDVAAGLYTLKLREI